VAEDHQLTRLCDKIERNKLKKALPLTGNAFLFV
jgi:hypothetical protein